MKHEIKPRRLHGIATFHHRDFHPALLRAAKGDTTVSVVLPALNEAKTIGPIVRAIRQHLVDGWGLVDELVVIDSDSTDATAEIAESSGAVVVRAGDVFPAAGRVLGKGDALWRSVQATKMDVIAWVDADIDGFSTRFVTGIIGPLLLDPDVSLCKGFYRRPLIQPDGSVSSGGGRVTELTARPALALLHPELRGIIQPLAGEYAVRRQVAESLTFTVGYGVEAGLLIDVARKYGHQAVTQVDLEHRIHRNRPLHDLTAMAYEVLRAILVRNGLDPADAGQLQRTDPQPASAPDPESGRSRSQLPFTGERPPVNEYRRKA